MNTLPLTKKCPETAPGAPLQCPCARLFWRDWFQINPRCCDHALTYIVETAFDHRARCLHVSAATELMREVVRIHATCGAERDLHAIVTEVTKEDRHARTSQGSRVFGDSLEILGPHIVLLRR